MGKISLGIIALWFGCLILGLMPVSAGEKIILRCADVHSFGYPTVEGVLYMSRLVKEQTDGRIEIVVYPESQLGSEASVVKMVRTGMLEMGRISASQVAEVAPEFGVFVLPYLFKNNSHKWKVLDGSIGTQLLNGLERVGLIGLCFQEAGYRSFYNSKHPIYRPEDLKGLRIRVQPNDIMVKLIDFLGAYPVPINYEEIGNALAARIIDGAENNIPSYYSAGHYQQALYYSFDRHSSIPEILLLSQKTWLSLTPSDRQIIANAAHRSVAYQRRLWIEYESQCLEKLAKAGCRINEVDLESFWKTGQLFIQKHASEHKNLVTKIRKVSGE